MKKNFFVLICVISVILSGCKTTPTPEGELQEATIAYKETTLDYLAQLDSVFAIMTKDNAQETMAEINRLETAINESFFTWQAVILASAQKAFNVSSQEELAALDMEKTNEWIKMNVETDEMLRFIEETEIRRLTVLDKAEVLMEEFFPAADSLEIRK